MPQPAETYCKGDFKGILFARFESNTGRDEVVGWFRKTSTKIQGTSIWSKPDRPLNERVIQSLVFGTKYLLDKSLWADPEIGSVTLWGEKVLKGSIEGEKLIIEYGNGWEEYLHDTKFPEFKNMVTALSAKLVKGGKGKVEGSSKENSKVKLFRDNSDLAMFHHLMLEMTIQIFQGLLEATYQIHLRCV